MRIGKAEKRWREAMIRSIRKGSSTIRRQGMWKSENVRGERERGRQAGEELPTQPGGPHNPSQVQQQKVFSRLLLQNYILLDLTTQILPSTGNFVGI